ncbi:unnamed protein product [Allacma fusca]|uniref:medium-chain acyl-CoA ligase n=1 Tax=Allacma fusca TaxID=39272 RepID=A0A8J2LGQ5_9HEXA|nr:unnamed protein product [Allacma fusca]
MCRRDLILRGTFLIGMSQKGLPHLPSEWTAMFSVNDGRFLNYTKIQLSPQDIEYRLGVSGAKVVITDPQNMWKVEEAQRNGKHSNLKKIVVGDGLSAEGWIQYEDLAENVLDADVLSFKNVDTKSDALSQVFFTSGTTGKPKMVGHTHASYGIGHYTTSYILDLQKNDFMWNISDPGWAKSSYSSFFAPWIAGCTVFIHQMERFEPAKVLQTLCDMDITTLCAPPTLYRSMVQEKDPSLFKFKAIRNFYGAGEAVNPEVSVQWKLKTGLPIHEFYGQTETTTIGAPPTQPKKPGSIGKIVTMDLGIVDENGQEVAHGVEGNISVRVKPKRPVGLLKGYMRPGPKGLEVNDEVDCYRGDFYLTGDRGYLDEDGYLFLVGRGDDVINSAGYRIGPYEVESVLLSHDAVAESAVVGYPDEKRGEVVKAFIVRTEKYQHADEETLIKNIQDFVKNNTAPYKYPRKIQFVDSLPKTISGKILRRELKKLGQRN